jgi:hypothetical protein
MTTTKTEPLEAEVAEMLKRHIPNHSHNGEPHTKEYLDQCNKCGLDIRGAYYDDERDGRVFIGWFSNEKNTKGIYVEVVRCSVEGL